MIAREIVSTHLPALPYETIGERAVMLMHELNVNQMPVVNGNEYIGLISFEEIMLLKHLNEPISAHHQSLKAPYVLESSHLFDVMKVALDAGLKIVPVLSDTDKKFVGVISAESCLKAFSELNSIIDEGGILEIVVSINDFVLSEIIRVIETNEVKVLACYTNIDQLKGSVEITIKTNSNDLAAVIAALERHEYEIKGFYHEKEYSEDLQDRYDALMHFLNV